MSLSSNKLNYLIWRYFQESGFNLAAYALDKHCYCLKYECSENAKELEEIHPGFLVELVQKGILFSIAEQELKKTGHELEHFDDKENKIQDKSDIINFEPETKFEESIMVDWCPNSEAIVYGKSNNSAVILKDNVKTVLNHSNISKINNEISFVSWSPLGDNIITCDSSIEMRIWTTEGMLKNIINIEEVTENKETQELVTITDVQWSKNGQYFFVLNEKGAVSIWKSETFSLIKRIKVSLEDGKTEQNIVACWLGDIKFAITTETGSINIYTISQVDQQHKIIFLGLLFGHEKSVSILSFDPKSKMLASCSDHNYLIKIWKSILNLNSVNLNSRMHTDLINHHNSPIVGLHWLESYKNSNFLLSVSMKGSINIWNCSNVNIKSLNILESNPIVKKLNSDFLIDFLVFLTALSNDRKILAIALNSGHIFVYDVSSHLYNNNSTLDPLKCLGYYDFDLHSNEKINVLVGVSDLKWDSNSKNLCISYRNSKSVVINVIKS